MTKKRKDKVKKIEDKVIELRLKGYSRNEISKELHLGHDRVQRILEKYSLTSRKGYDLRKVKKKLRNQAKKEERLPKGVHRSYDFLFHCRNSKSEVDHYFTVKQTKGINSINALNYALYSHAKFYPNHVVESVDFVGSFLVEDNRMKKMKRKKKKSRKSK